MRKELKKLKEELIDGECPDRFATPVMFKNGHFQENANKERCSLLLESIKQLSFAWLTMCERTLAPSYNGNCW